MNLRKIVFIYLISMSLMNFNSQNINIDEGQFMKYVKENLENLFETFIDEDTHNEFFELTIEEIYEEIYKDFTKNFFNNKNNNNYEITINEKKQIKNYIEAKYNKQYVRIESHSSNMSEESENKNNREIFNDKKRFLDNNNKVIDLNQIKNDKVIDLNQIKNDLDKKMLINFFKDLKIFKYDQLEIEESKIDNTTLEQYLKKINNIHNKSSTLIFNKIYKESRKKYRKIFKESIENEPNKLIYPAICYSIKSHELDIIKYINYYKKTNPISFRKDLEKKINLENIKKLMKKLFKTKDFKDLIEKKQIKFTPDIEKNISTKIDIINILNNLTEGYVTMYEFFSLKSVEDYINSKYQMKFKVKNKITIFKAYQLFEFKNKMKHIWKDAEHIELEFDSEDMSKELENEDNHKIFNFEHRNNYNNKTVVVEPKNDFENNNNLFNNELIFNIQQDFYNKHERTDEFYKYVENNLEEFFKKYKNEEKLYENLKNEFSTKINFNYIIEKLEQIKVENYIQKTKVINKEEHNIELKYNQDMPEELENNLLENMTFQQYLKNQNNIENISAEDIYNNIIIQLKKNKPNIIKYINNYKNNTIVAEFKNDFENNNKSLNNNLALNIQQNFDNKHEKIKEDKKEEFSEKSYILGSESEDSIDNNYNQQLSKNSKNIKKKREKYNTSISTITEKIMKLMIQFTKECKKINNIKEFDDEEKKQVIELYKKINTIKKGKGADRLKIFNILKILKIIDYRSFFKFPCIIEYYQNNHKYDVRNINNDNLMKQCSKSVLLESKRTFERIFNIKIETRFQRLNRTFANEK